MLLNTLKSPITLINLAELGIDTQEVQGCISKEYQNYEPDNYLLRQNKVSLLKSQFSRQELDGIDPNVWMGIYEGLIADSDLPALLPGVSDETLEKVSELRPTRYRLVSEFVIARDGDWSINRVPRKGFAQPQALITGPGVDYRIFAREFKELPDSMYDTNLNRILAHLSEQIGRKHESVQKIEAVVHHTIIRYEHGQISTNSPEGIHQDGADYILSALVIERNNIGGGTSIIYGSDKKTPIFECELQVGQGIMQPDLGTDLWHEVTPIHLLDESKPGYRASIGVDIKLVE
ncbi:2OG-Fe dioxygenase family protein [Azotobacter vinelandii]